MRRHDNHFLIYFFMMFVLVSSVLAIKPQTQVSSSEPSILYPKESVFKVDNNISLHFHFANGSNYVLPNTLFTCNGHVYNPLNQHISVQELGNDLVYGLDKEINLDASIINTTGLYSYDVWCNSSSESAFVSDGFYVNNSGNSEDNNDWLAIGIVLIMIASVFFYASYIIKNEKLQMVKILFFVYGSFTLFFTGVMPYIITLNPGDIISFKDVGEGLVIVYLVGLLAFIFMYGYHLIINIGASGEKKKNG